MQPYTKTEFHLSAALEGKPCVTADGWDVRILSTDLRGPLPLVVGIMAGNEEVVRSYSLDGKCSSPSRKLYMKCLTIGGWFNIYKDRKVDPTIYGTKTQAQDARSIGCVATIHTTWNPTEEV